MLNAGEVGENRDSGRIAGYRSMTAAVRDQQVTAVDAVLHNSYGCRRETARRFVSLDILHKSLKVTQGYSK